MSGGEPVTCCTLWIGGNLGPVAAACLASFARRGHRVVLYCYDQPADVPPGVETADAATIIPREKIFLHGATKSYALFSDLFRYELMRAEAGVWIDCDLYCLRPIISDKPYIFGWQRALSINGAILRLPPESSVLAKLLDLFERKSYVPPWLNAEATAHFLARRMAGVEFSLMDLPWGSAGPDALTFILGEERLQHLAAPADVYYAVHWNNGPMLLKAGADIRKFVTPRTLTIHLWNETLSKHMQYLERGSAVHRLITEGTLFDEGFLNETAA
jgi:hypothetical protein